MDRFFTILHQIWVTKNLRDRILFTIFALIVFRLVAHITIPGADVEKIRFIMQQGDGNSLLGIFSMLTGGAMENFSIVLMGLTPYINASIILQLLGVIVPALEDIKKEGEAGQRKINQYTRILTVPLAFVQSYGMLMLINRFSPGGAIIDMANWGILLPMMLTVTAGTVFLMWLGELISEKGLGNGVSILIFAGIVSTVPTQIGGALGAAETPVILGLAIATIVLTLFVVFVAEADRRIPVVYATRKGGKGQRSFLPMKINQAGMIPIIFAVSLASMPSIMSQFFVKADSVKLQKIGEMFMTYFNPGSPTVWYNTIYALLIFAFTFFYVSITFEPKKVAENIQKRGGYIPGYRPGKETESFLEDTSNRLAFWGAIFLSVIAILPMVFQRWMSGGAGTISLFISGAGMIIVVSVVLDIIRRINSQLVAHDYDKL
jgi:preprotein translocase subunit SecY